MADLHQEMEVLVLRWLDLEALFGLVKVLRDQFGVVDFILRYLSAKQLAFQVSTFP